MAVALLVSSTPPLTFYSHAGSLLLASRVYETWFACCPHFVVPHNGRVVGAVHTRALPEVGVLLEAKDTP